MIQADTTMHQGVDMLNGTDEEGVGESIESFIEDQVFLRFMIWPFAARPRPPPSPVSNLSLFLSNTTARKLGHP